MRSIMRRRSGWGGAGRGERRRGAALVEMALVTPLFFTIILGIVEFGRAMMVGQLVTNAAREGARIAVIGDSSNAEVTQEIQSFLQNSANISPSIVTVQITITPYAGNPAVSDVSNASYKDLVTINVQVPFTQVSFLPPSFLDEANLTGQCAMRVE